MLQPDHAKELWRGAHNKAGCLKSAITALASCVFEYLLNPVISAVHFASKRAETPAAALRSNKANH